MTNVPGNPEAGQLFESSFTEGTFYDTRIFIGRIVGFNLETYGVEVHLDNAASDLDDIQISCPYFHYSNGEGFYAVPEVGARCAVVFPSDGSAPYVAAFLGVVEEVSAKASDESQTPGGQDSDGKTPQEMEDEGTTPSDQDDLASTSDPVSYRNGRPLLRPGDMAWRTRDGNGIILRRGGLLSIGSNGVCQRLYIPINNLIQDFAQNYKLTTPGRNFTAELFEQDSDNTRVQSIMTIREYAEDSNASLSIRMGELEDNFYELSLKRTGIDYKKGTVIDESDLSLLLTKEGDWDLTCQTQNITATERNVIVSGTETEEFDELDQKVSGKRSIHGFKEENKDGSKSTETLSASKTIEAPSVKLGKGKRSALVRADLFIALFNSHIHLIPGGSTGPPSPVLTEALIGTKTVEGA